jgi:adenine-specific DNA methylase
MHVLGIHGDPVKAKLRIEKATREGVRLGAEAYGYARAFTHAQSDSDRAWISAELARAGHPNPTLLDPTAGGGSIPFEAVRLGVNSIANDLNAVAALVLRTTVEFPLLYGTALKRQFDKFSAEFIRRVRERLMPFYPPEADANTRSDGYLWARTIKCPYCHGTIPLSPNWRLSPDGSGIRLVPDTSKRTCSFEVVSRSSKQSQGTVRDGDGQCPYLDCGRVVENDVIKRQAESGEMGEQLFAVVYKRRTNTGNNRRHTWKRGYRSPRDVDDVSDLIRATLADKIPEWEAMGVIPSEVLPFDTESWTHGNTPAQYGARRFQDLFSPRQLLCLCFSVEVIRELTQEICVQGKSDPVDGAAVSYLALALDKLANWNSRLSSWNVNYERLRSTFDSHNFKLVWSFAEMPVLVEGVGFDWIVEQASKSIGELVDLLRPHDSRSQAAQTSFPEPGEFTPPNVTVTNQSADALDHLKDHAIDAIVMDPPYYDNVMYAELADFFYVWLKRTAGLVYPELFRRQLTDKENEAVANIAKFDRQPGARELAARDYQQRMASIFAECRRVLKPDGVMTVMFTHKATGAWDALASGLLEAEFTITASWPVNTEFEASQHIRDKAAANSTIFLVCRPHADRPAGHTRYWEDVEPLVGKKVRERIEDFAKAGVRGVDLYLSCFGPALEVLAEHWPLTRGQPRSATVKKGKGKRKAAGEAVDPYAVMPEDALDAARREVKKWKLDKLLHTTRHADLDPMTEWFVLAWDAFKAPEFPYDEALRLAGVVGLDLDGDIIGKLGEKKGGDVLLWDSGTRAAKGVLGPADGSRALVDALHHAAHRARTASLDAAREQLAKTGADQHLAFTAALTAVLEVLPVSSTFTKIADEKGPVAEAAGDFDALEHLRRLAYQERVPEPEQLKLWKEGQA